ncbi:alpha/beta hydrolase [Rhodococcus daqingensis]|uniref:Alpha/beta hydrolase n=1 Tax=Rhodococcus daqingensis TaxID=2479363 RepID=A0ABW2RTM9_9NOCA
MPFFAGASGQVHYRHWPVPEPVAGMVFLHGMGQHSGHYHRFARALGAARIEVWALDHVGHGLSEGDLGVYGPVPELGQNALLLTEIAEDQRPGLPLVVMGHSLGAAAAIETLGVEPARFRAAVLCGLPRAIAQRPPIAARLPILAVHGVDDRLAPIDAVRSWADAMPSVALREYPDAGHDLLHEPVRHVVTSDVVDFVLGTVQG